MQINDATNTVIKLPVDVLDIRVYHSGKNNRTPNTDSTMGMLNRTAMGKPFMSLDCTVPSFSLSRSQYTINCRSFSVIMQQN